MTITDAPPTLVLDKLRAEHEDVLRALLHLQFHEALLPAGLYPPYVSHNGRVDVMCRDRSEFEQVVEALFPGETPVPELGNMTVTVGSLRVWVERDRYQPPTPHETVVSCVSHRFGATHEAPALDRLAREGEWT